MENNAVIKRYARFFARVFVGLCLMVLVWSCANVPGLREETSSTFIRVPFVRVLLDSDHFKINVDAEESFAIECLLEGRQRVFYSTRPVTIENTQSSLTVKNIEGLLIEEGLDEINIIPRGGNNRVVYNNKRYRGLLKINPVGENLQIINIVYIEDYLRGVVPPEIGKRDKSEIEAVKAQAVAARTYAMSHLQQYENSGYDLRSDIMDQVYEGVEVENKLINKAIEETSGYVVTHNDKFIQAYYHSTCGGATDDIAEIWDRGTEEYLKSVDDSYACAWSKYFNWTETFTEEKMRRHIEEYLEKENKRKIQIGEIQDISIVDVTTGGRVAMLRVRTSRDVYTFYKDRIRWVLKRNSNDKLILPSTRFNVKINRDETGRVVTIDIIGGGYGHGIGMCQCGAIGMSRTGWQFVDILKHYYTGVEVKKLY